MIDRHSRLFIVGRWLLVAIVCGCVTNSTRPSGNARHPLSPPGNMVRNDASARVQRLPEIHTVAYQEPPEPLPAPSLLPDPAAPKSPPPTRSDPVAEEKGSSESVSTGSVAAIPPLTLDTVTQSVYMSFPALEAAIREMDIAEGKQLSTQGEFDLKLKSENLAAPLGFYQNYRQLAKLEQSLYRGANIYGQYRIGDGDFPTWYGERETNEGGEFKVGIVTPLLRDRAIDQRRADMFRATYRRRQVDPSVQSQLLEFILFASEGYWSWVAAGQSLDVQRELLRVTTERNKAFVERVNRHDLAPIELLQNQRLIASRETKLIEAERKLQQAEIKLSLFLRDEQGRPMIPAREQLPARFPLPAQVSPAQVATDIQTAISNRPELRELRWQRREAEVDLALGRNQMLPGLNAAFESSQDVGGAASSKRDKSPFELEAGILLDVPLQRRKARGKIMESRGKIGQLSAKQRFTEDKIAIQVRDAISALATAYDRILKASESARLAKELEIAERHRFDVGDSDLLRVALQEGSAIEAELLEIEALADYFKAQASYHAAVATDPLSSL